MSLLSEISDFDELYASWRSVPKTTSGEDNIGIDQFKADVVGHLRKIRTDLKKGTYLFSPIHQKDIKKKKSGKTRSIHLYTIKDKIVQRAIQRAFQRKRETLGDNCLFPGMINDVSIAYIPKSLRSKDISGVIGSTNLVSKYLTEGFPVLTTLDIESFFDRVDLQQLSKVISERLGDDTSINWLLEQFYDPEVIKTDYHGDDFSVTTTGLKQGSILAPLFSNIYLMDFDSELMNSGIKAIRYADDVAIFSESEEQAKKHIDIVQALLVKSAGIGFYASGDKGPTTLNINRQHAVEFLGIRYVKEADELRKYPVQSKVNGLKEKIVETVNRNDLSFVQIVTKLNSSLNGWNIFYQGLGCHKATLNRMYLEITQLYYEQIDKLLRKRGITETPLSKKKLKYLGIAI